MFFHKRKVLFGWFPGLPSLKARAQYKSNNHLTGGILHTVKKRGSDAKRGFLGRPGFDTGFSRFLAAPPGGAAGPGPCTAPPPPPDPR